MRNALFRIVILSGAICAGKSTLARALQTRYEARVMKTRDLIQKARPRIQKTRRAFQRAEDTLDRQQGGMWVANGLVDCVAQAEGTTPSGMFVVNSARTVEQIRCVRNAFGINVHHIHLTAEPDELKRRYEERQTSEKGNIPYEQVKKNTE